MRHQDLNSIAAPLPISPAIKGLTSATLSFTLFKMLLTISQERGVANAISATSLQNGVFTKGVQHLVQNSFNPRRSGDIIIWLTPERIEEQPNKVADSGSPYNYDRHVPLIIYGGGIPATRYNRRVCATQLTPTLASLLGVSRPNASDAEILNEIKHK